MKPMSENRPLIAHVLFDFGIARLQSGTAYPIGGSPVVQRLKLSRPAAAYEVRAVR
jgi:hypothetical protein